jgi:hypothetical protein
LREIAVFGGTAHSALAAEICADLGVRCAAKPGQQRHCLAVPPGCGVEQRDPSTMSPGSTAPRSTIFTIFEGTSEIQRMIIGRAVTGLDVRQADLPFY